MQKYEKEFENDVFEKSLVLLNGILCGVVHRLFIGLFDQGGGELYS